MADSITNITRDKLKSSRPSSSSGDIIHMVITDEVGEHSVDPDANGNMPVSITPGSNLANWSDSVSDENSRVVKNSAGILFGLTGVNSGITQWIQVHDAVTLPADGAVPKIVIRVNADSNFAWSCNFGKDFDNGIVICNSSTKATKTIGAANCWFNVEYE